MAIKELRKARLLMGANAFFTYGNIMTSILTNTSSMIALQTLRSINKDLGAVQEQVSSGKKVGSAKDNAATWAISKVMESDASSFKKISEGLAIAESTVAVARSAAETTTDLLTQMRNKIVQAKDPAQANNLSKIQADIEALRGQITSVVGAAQFNGINLVNRPDSIEVLASLDRTGTSVEPGKITVAGKDLSLGGYVARNGFAGTTANQVSFDTAAFTVSHQGSGTLTLATPTLPAPNYAIGDTISVRVGGQTVSHTYTQDDVDNANTNKHEVVAAALLTKINGLSPDITATRTAGELTINNNTGAALSVTAQFSNAGSGALSMLSRIDVTTSSSLANALTYVESALQVSIDAAAEFGTAQSRIQTQSDFIGKLVTSLQTGIGAMVDADMEEASARLQALQTQQQLGIQSLAIANQAPAAIMALFR